MAPKPPYPTEFNAYCEQQGFPAEEYAKTAEGQSLLLRLAFRDFGRTLVASLSEWIKRRLRPKSGGAP